MREEFSRIKRAFILPAAVLLFICGSGARLFADTIYLKNGRSIEGLVKRDDGDYVELEISLGSMKFSKKQIDRIVTSSAKEAEAIRQQWEEEKTRSRERAREEEIRREHEPKQVNMDKQSGHVVVTALLNNKVRANLVLDTGASLILLSKKIADKLGMDVNRKDATPIELIMADGRREEARMVTLESVRVQDSEARNIEAAVLPDKESAVMSEDGLLGMSFLKKFNFKIDQKNDKLILEKL
ncbi:MAG: retropepsin-like aspartic protease [Candidatus Omnitrophica bacterium]|nr:retropepsin-like aspartic protease [Candidatus Omnitrophota bacterium]MDD5771246.1 retropepsin-like aspartic protease [Candidatus Omnitrophota bacterium]